MYFFCIPLPDVSSPVSPSAQLQRGTSPSRLELISFIASHLSPEALLGPPLPYLFSQEVFFLVFCQAMQMTFLCS